MNNEKTFKMFVGPMWSSKTTHLLMELEKCKFQQRSAVLFKPAIDDRYSGTHEVVSHAGYRWQAVPVSNGEDMIQFLYDQATWDTIALDEAFMVPGAGEVLVWLFRNGHNIIVSSLDLSSQLKEFEEIKHMMPWATHITKLDAACSVCHATARYSYRKLAVQDENAIHVGGALDYEPRCHRCHPLFEEGA